jgi:hypothetical protein
MAKFDLPFTRRDDEPPRPTAWELFLLGTGVLESNCSSLLSARTQKGRAIRSWVRENYTKKFVPEHILETLGLRRQLRLRWQADE